MASVSLHSGELRIQGRIVSHTYGDGYIHVANGKAIRGLETRSHVSRASLRTTDLTPSRTVGVSRREPLFTEFSIGHCPNGRTRGEHTPRDDSMDEKKMRYCAFISLILLAFFTRLVPLSFSPYPFNNDSLTECALASQILTDGDLPLASNSSFYNEYSLDIPALNVLLAEVASVIGCSSFDCAQIVNATLSVLTVCSVYVLARLFTRSWHGGLVAGLSAALMGTFVFTTASVWKESLGICLFLLLIVVFARRDRIEFRLVSVTILALLPLVHHLVAIISILALSYPLAWSWCFAISHRSWRTRHTVDVISITGCAVWTIVYYDAVSFNRLLYTTDYTLLVLLFASVAVMSVVMIVTMSIRTHIKITFSPFVAVFVGTFILLDYYGYLYPYESALSFWPLFILICVSALLIGVSWYGTEVLIEQSNRYRAIQLGLLLAPLTIITIAMGDSLSLLSHKVLYRTFDFFGPFLFLGIGVAYVQTRLPNRRKSLVMVIALLVALLASLPFAFATEDLTGVRHDTQSYEVDALQWIALNSGYDWVISDERLAYIAQAMAGLPKDNGFPSRIAGNSTLFYDACYMFEDEWLDKGVNYYPKGMLIVTGLYWNWTERISDVFYIGGPLDNRATILTPSHAAQSLYGLSD